METDALTGRELDAAIAERVMQWHKAGIWWADAEGTLCFMIESFNPSVEPGRAFTMEEEIFRQGWHREYVYQLVQVARPPEGDSEGLWGVIHATPEQRCRAALEAANWPERKRQAELDGMRRLADQAHEAIRRMEGAAPGADKATPAAPTS